MKSRIFEQIQKAFSDVRFEAEPTTDLVMVESLKVYRSILVVMRQEALHDLNTNKASEIAAQEAAAALPRINERLRKVDSYINTYSTPADVVTSLPDFKKSTLAICRIRPGNKVDRNAVSVLRLLDEGDSQQVDDPRAYLIVRQGFFVKKTGRAESTVYKWTKECGIQSVDHYANLERSNFGLSYSTDYGVTFQPLPDVMEINDSQVELLRKCGYEPINDSRFKLI